MKLELVQAVCGNRSIPYGVILDRFVPLVKLRAVPIVMLPDLSKTLIDHVNCSVQLLFRDH